jgi:hypothetical protein
MTRAVHPIVGTWTLKSFTELDVGTQAISYPMGQAARASVIYTAGGHVATIFAAEVRNRPEATP